MSRRFNFISSDFGPAPEQVLRSEDTSALMRDSVPRRRITPAAFRDITRTFLENLRDDERMRMERERLRLAQQRASEERAQREKENQALRDASEVMYQQDVSEAGGGFDAQGLLDSMRAAVLPQLESPGARARFEEMLRGSELGRMEMRKLLGQKAEAEVDKFRKKERLKKTLKPQTGTSAPSEKDIKAAFATVVTLPDMIGDTPVFTNTDNEPVETSKVLNLPVPGTDGEMTAGRLLAANVAKVAKRIQNVDKSISFEDASRIALELLLRRQFLRVKEGWISDELAINPTATEIPSNMLKTAIGVWRKLGKM